MVTNAEYNKAKNAVNNQYTEESIQNYTNAYNNYMKQWLSSTDALAKAKWLLVDKNTTPTNIPTQNSTQTTGSTVSKTNNSNATKVSGNTVLPEYQWSWNQNKVQTSYSNQWTGNYTYNPTSWYYEKSQNYNTIRDAWDSKTYEQQQELLKNNPNLKEWITKVGGTIKQSPYQNQWEGQYQYNPKTWYYEKQGSQWGNETPTNKWDWDYQDNSPERTAEIIRNLDDLSKSNPWLFSDYDTFYNAFIAGKGRSPEQEKVLNDYFNKMKQYNKYDNMSSDELWYLLAHWEPAEDYLSYLKYNDPQRYAEIQESRKKNENQIMNETYLNTVASQAGYEMWDSDFWKWNQEEMWYRDVNKDWLDDRLYHAPTEEELKLVDENNQYEQERAKLTDAYKWLQEDLTNQYPDADLSTIMLLTSDRWNKIQRALDTLAVNQTKVQWSLKYLQNERATMDKAWQSTINEIQKQYGMYYDYSPQWIAERAQAEYAANNVTLDQADNGTDTQKQMALDKVLSDYYDKYWSIIQRSKSQVINDVMKLAKDKWISLSEALQENFITPLKSKPDYETLSTGRTIANSQQDKWAKLSDDKLFNTVTWEVIDANGNTVSGWTTASVWSTVKAWNWVDYTVQSSEQLISWLSDFISWYNEWDVWGWCWAFVNKGLKDMWVTNSNMYGDSKESKLNSKNEEADATPQTWWVAIWNPDKLTWDGNKFGHIWFVIKDNGDGTVKVVDSNWVKNAKWEYDKTVHVHDVNKSSLYGYFNPSKWTTSDNWDLYYAKVLSWIPTQLRNTDVEKQWYIDIAREQKEKWLTPFEAAMSIIWFDITNKSQEAQDVKNKVLGVVRSQWEDTMFNSAVLSSIAEDINSSNYEWALLTLENQLWKYMSEKLKTNFNRDWLTSAMQAISDFDTWNTNWIKWIWNSLSSYIWWDWAKTIKFNSNLSNLSNAMRSLWFTDDEIERLLPKITYNKSNFKASIDELQKNILNKYNAMRRNHWMPSETRASLLWNLPLSSVYGLNAEMEAIDSI